MNNAPSKRRTAIRAAFYARFGRVPGHTGDAYGQDVRTFTGLHSATQAPGLHAGLLTWAAWHRRHGDPEDARDFILNARRVRGTRSTLPTWF